MKSSYFQTKFFFLSLFAATAICFGSCTDDDCTDDLVGLYTGANSCQPGVTLSLTISASSTEGQIVFSIPGSTNWNGTISGDCVITINQNITGLGPVNGTWSLTGTALTGNFTFADGSSCIYTFSKL